LVIIYFSNLAISWHLKLRKKEKYERTAKHRIQTQLCKLKKEGIIKRIGPAKGGKWEVVK